MCSRGAALYIFDLKKSKGRAEVTLFGCAPREEGETAKVEERVIRRTRKMGAEFLEYDAGKNRGTWRFVAAL